MTCQHCGSEGDHIKKYDKITVLGDSLPLCPKCHYEQLEYLKAYWENKKFQDGDET